MSNSGKDEYNQGVITLADARERAHPDESAAPTGVDGFSNGFSNEVGKAHDTVKIMDRLRAKGMLVPDSTLSPIIRSEYRRVKRPLLANAFGKSAALVDQGNLIMVTSAVPGEGKTFTAVNLALAFAQERDHTVLLVDCDVTKQGMSRLLGIERRRPDVTDLLASDNMPISDALLRTDVPGLVLLPAGKPHEYITEMIASHRMERIVNELATRYSDRIVVLDGPPLLSTPEAQVLTGLAGQIVYVIEAGKTPYAIVQDALDMLPRDKAIGMLLNKSESISNRGGYYYNYYAAYGEEKSDHKKPE
jgi:exopolysaccharide/PEP-CTERM locus tyrosine autokinase